MMLGFCLAAGILFAALFLLYFYKYRKLSGQLTELENQLDESLKKGGEDSILVYSDEPAIRQLAARVNRLLEEQGSLTARTRMQEERERRMLVNISHDLKTPLTVVYGYAEMLLAPEQNLTPAVRTKVEKIYAKTRDVLDMLLLFFDLAKMESGELQLDRTQIDVCEICRSELAGYYEMLQDADFVVEASIPEEELFLEGDAQAMKRILGNLIQNAIRYGADGRYLGVSVGKEGSGLAIRVTDRGKGIVEENQDKIFERLTTLEDSRNKKYQGSGLGLTITKRLTEAMGGSIRVKSRPYRETVFTLLFPQDGQM
ncbi:sensor histidine kinase [Eisenbergiella sp.]